jgi:Flp pilus assembly CpaF family ATPase
MTQTAVELRAVRSLAESKEVVERYRHYLGEASVLLDEPDVTDISRNPQDSRIWAISNTRGKVSTPYQQTTQQAEGMIGAIVAEFNTEFNYRNPLFLGVLPYHGARFTAARTPVVGGVMWTIRKPNNTVLTFQDYLDAGIIPSKDILERIRTYISERKNILVAGPMGVGKTTLANTLIAEIDRMNKGRDRWIIIEDTDELRCSNPDHVKLLTNSPLGINWSDLIAFSLRTTGTRIVLGEIRSAARSLLEAWQVGAVGNVATIHGDNADDVMRRFESLLLKEGGAIDRHEISKTIGAIIVIGRVGVGRKVKDVVRIQGVTEHGYSFRQG